MATFLTLINYCSHDYRFLHLCVNQAKKVSTEVVIVACDHFHTGDEENIRELEKVKSELTGVNFLILPYEEVQKTIGNKHYCAVIASAPRQLAFNKVKGRTDYTMFMDVDEIIEAERFNERVQHPDFSGCGGAICGNYWYFRDVRHRAKAELSNSCFIIRTQDVPENFVSVHDRWNIWECAKEPKLRDLKGLDGKPFVHHYSWVGTKEQMLKKAAYSGHRAEKDFAKLIEEEHSHPETSLVDFVHQFELEVCEPPSEVTTPLLLCCN
jgi:hypothetical protein